MLIRKASVQDMPYVKRMADSLVVTPNSTDKTWGFYDYSLTLEQYQRRVESELFLITENNSQLEGFCMAYDSEFVRRLTQQEPQLKEDVVFDYLNHADEDYVYVDQLAVKKPKSFIGSVSACKLFDRLMGMSEGRESLVTVIPHYPWKNMLSIRFAEHQGGKLVKEIGRKGKIVFGVYRLSLV